MKTFIGVSTCRNTYRNYQTHLSQSDRDNIEKGKQIFEFFLLLRKRSFFIQFHFSKDFDWYMQEIGQFRSIGNSLTYTPLVSHQDEYYINVKSILINGRRISINKSLLSLTKISTIVPYTTMETTIYNTFTKGYIIAASSMNLTKVAPVEPFSVCFSTRGVGETVVGPKVPEIELGLQSGMVKWKINGRNSMVKVSDEVMCLAFLDGGLNLKDSIVIGGYQLEDNLFEFNLGTSMLGFSSSLLGRGTSCSDFRLNSMTTELF